MVCRRRRAKPKQQKEVLAEFRGYVLSADGTDTFWICYTDEDGIEYHGEVRTSEVKEQDRHLIIEGYRFTWKIYQYTPRNNNHAYSEFEFDEPEYWTKEDIDAVEEKAAKLIKLFGLDKD